MRKERDIHQIIHAIQEVVGQSDSFTSLHEPTFKGNEWNYVKECIDTGWVSSVGQFVDKFEELLKEFTGVEKAVAVVNGTAALHICLKLAGVRDGDEVFIPSLTFIATANAVCYCGAIPHFVDSEERTLGLDPFKLDDYLIDISEIKNGECFNKVTGRRIKAVVAMHTFGHPVDLDPLLDVCERFHLELIEDAAESLGSYYKGRHTGNWGKLSALSFNGNKIITTGGGGAILTNDEALGKMVKHITTTAKLPHKWAFIHDQIGYNYRLPNLNAALGCAQIEQLPDFLTKKRQLSLIYQEAFAKIEGVTAFVEPEFAQSNYWLNVLLLDHNYYHLRDSVLQVSNDKGIMTRPVWTLMHTLPMFDTCPRMELSTAENLERAILNVPSSPKLDNL